MLDVDPTLLGERLDTGRATQLAVTRVLHAAEGGHGLIDDALVLMVNATAFKGVRVEQYLIGPDVVG